MWVLGHAYHYDHTRRGRIKGSTEYTFAWESAKRRFVLSTRTEEKELPMPVDLAEAFLLQCLDRSFRERVIIDSACTVQEHVSVGGARLCLRHCQVRYSCKPSERLPGLSLSVESGAGTGYLHLPYQVRMDFGLTMARTMPEEVHMMLHMPRAA